MRERAAPKAVDKVVFSELEKRLIRGYYRTTPWADTQSKDAPRARGKSKQFPPGLAKLRRYGTLLPSLKSGICRLTSTPSCHNCHRLLHASSSTEMWR